MAKGTRLPEETKIDIAERYHSGGKTKEEVKELAERFGVSAYTVKDYASRYRKKAGGVKRKVTVQPVQQKPKENTRVSPFEAENKGLREENQRLRNLLLDEILRNK